MHAYDPDVLLLGTISPIPKQNNMAHISDKYRAITHVSCILKLLDYIIIDKQSHVFHTDSLQFGFKSKSSTMVCTSMITEMVRLFNSGNSKVFAVLLDAAKAFDRVEFTKIFGLLLERGMEVGWFITAAANVIKREINILISDNSIRLNSYLFVYIHSIYYTDCPL